MADELVFAHPWILGLLALLPGAGYLAWRRQTRSSATFRFSRAHLVASLGTLGVAARFRWVPPTLRLTAIGLGLVALARPQLIDPGDVEVEGLDIVVALDMSGSMQAVDLDDAHIRAYQAAGKEPPTRFDIAKEVLLRFIESRRTDRIGLVVFGEHAYTQFPLTLDYSAMVQIIDRLELGDISGDATVIGNALGKCLNLLRSSDAKTKLAILITDGENTGGNIDPMQAANFADTLGVRVFTILVGSNQAKVPAGRDFFTGRVVYRAAQFSSDPDLLERMAQRTGGEFYRAEDRKALEERFANILSKFEKSRVRDVGSAAPKELFPQLLAVAVGLLFLEALLSLTILRKIP